MAARVVQGVELWPTGFPDLPWESDPDVDAFCRSGVAVAMAYSEGLAALRLPSHRSVLRLSCGRPSPDGAARVTVVVDRLDGDLEHAGVGLPTGVAGWAPGDRARLVLEVLHAAVARLGEARGWERAPLDRLRDETAAGDLRPVSASPWRSSPDRRYRARVQTHVAPDGFGRTVLEVADGEDRVVAASAEVLSWPRARDLGPLRWTGRDEVGLTTIRTGVPARESRAVLRYADGAWHDHSLDGFPGLLPVAGAGAPEGRVLPRVVVVGHGVDAPEQVPYVVAGGVGPVNGVAAEYLSALHDGFRVLADESGQQWWQAAGTKQLTVSCTIGSGPDVRSRRVGDRLQVTIRRPAASTHTGSTALAAADVRAAVAEVRRRTGLGPHPTLGG